MPKAREVLSKAASTSAPSHVERRIGKKPGEVHTRTVIGGKSFDHVHADREAKRTELHPTNIRRLLGMIDRTPSGSYRASANGKNLGEHPDAHKAARAIVTHVPNAIRPQDDLDEPVGNYAFAVGGQSGTRN